MKSAPLVYLVRARTAARSSRMPARRFIPYTTVVAGLWAVTFCVLGYAFWHSLDQVMAAAPQRRSHPGHDQPDPKW